MDHTVKPYITSGEYRMTRDAYSVHTLSRNEKGWAPGGAWRDVPRLFCGWTPKGAETITGHDGKHNGDNFLVYVIKRRHHVLGLLELLERT